MAVKWNIGETTKLISITSTVIGVDPETGKDKKRHKRNAVDVKYDYPVIAADSMEDLYKGLEEILAANTTGFTSVRQLVDHVNFGLNRSIATALNRGSDPSMSAAQREAVKMYAKLFHNNMGITREFAVDTLTRQGIADAANIFDVAVAGFEGGDSNAC